MSKKLSGWLQAASSTALDETQNAMTLIYGPLLNDPELLQCNIDTMI